MACMHAGMSGVCIPIRIHSASNWNLLDLPNFLFSDLLFENKALVKHIKVVVDILNIAHHGFITWTVPALFVVLSQQYTYCFRWLSPFFLRVFALKKVRSL